MSFYCLKIRYNKIQTHLFYLALAVENDTFQEIVRRVVEVAHPDKVILFGSAARGETGYDSDIDLLVVASEPVHRGHLTEKIYMNLIGLGQAVDIVVVTQADVEKYRNNDYLVIAPALREGKVLYDRESTAA